MATPEFYIDGVPFKVSKSFEPVMISDSIVPIVPNILRYNTNYDFEVEKFALAEANRREEEIFKEAEQVRQRYLRQIVPRTSTVAAINGLNPVRSSISTNVPTSAHNPNSAINSVGSMNQIAVMNTTCGITTISGMNPVNGMNPTMNPISVTNPTNGINPPSVINESMATKTVVKQMYNYNPQDFESSGSSPFDDALLKAIDDRKELDNIFNNRKHY